MTCVFFWLDNYLIHYRRKLGFIDTFTKFYFRLLSIVQIIDIKSLTEYFDYSRSHTFYFSANGVNLNECAVLFLSAPKAQLSRRFSICCSLLIQ